MTAEAPTAGSTRCHRDRSTGGLSPATAILGAVLLVAVAFVPALAPDAAAGSSGDTCFPEDPRVDTSLVLDRSASMDGDKIDDAKSGAIGFVENLTADDQSGLVSYADEATVDANLSFDHRNTTQAIENLTAGGDTATGKAIDRSHADLENRSRPDVTPTMILLSDGKTNEGPDPVQEADEAKADGVEIFTIAFGDGADEEELKEIASDPVETHFYAASGGDELEAVYDQILDETKGQDPLHAGQAYGIRVDVTTDQAVQRTTLHGTPQAVAPPGGQDEIVDEPLEAAGVTVEVEGASVEVDGETSLGNVSAEARSRIADLRVATASETVVEADLLTASAQAWSTPDDEATSAQGSRLHDVRVHGSPVSTPVEPDTVVPLGDTGTLTLNEQVETRQGENATLRVNAVHLELEDGPRTVDVTVGSAYAAAACSLETSYDRPAEEGSSASGDATDDERGAGPASVNPGGEASNEGQGCGFGEGCAAASAFGEAENADECSQGPCVAASGTDDATNARTECRALSLCAAATGTGDAENAQEDCDTNACVAATGTGRAENAGSTCGSESACVAASGVGDARNGGGCLEAACVALSGTGDASNTDDGCFTAACVAASGTGDAQNADGECDTVSVCVAVSGTGTANGTVAVSGGHPRDPVDVDAPVSCDPGSCAAVAAEDDADGQVLAASGTGNASAPVSASGTGDARSPETECSGLDPCVGVSGTGDAAGDAAVSGTGDADGLVALAGAGDADGFQVGVSGTGNASGTVAASFVGNADGTVPVGVTGKCNGRSCYAVNDTSPARGHYLAVSPDHGAHASNGVAASGTGPSSTTLGVAVSGAGPASTFLGVAVSGEGPASTTQGAAVSGTDDADAKLGVAASGTGDADNSNGLTVSGCNGVGVHRFPDTVAHVPSPVPVCEVPAGLAGPPGDAPPLP